MLQCHEIKTFKFIRNGWIYSELNSSLSRGRDKEINWLNCDFKKFLTNNLTWSSSFMCIMRNFKPTKFFEKIIIVIKCEETVKEKKICDSTTFHILNSAAAKIGRRSGAAEYKGKSKCQWQINAREGHWLKGFLILFLSSIFIINIYRTSLFLIKKMLFSKRSWVGY